jgi:hypothetical protein
VAPSDALEIAKLVWPTLVRKDDCILLRAKFSEENYRSWRDRCGQDSTAIESVINHVHLWDVFQGDEEDSVLWQLAELLKTTWAAAAQDQFPEESFEINVYDSYGPTIELTLKR